MTTHASPFEHIEALKQASLALPQVMLDTQHYLINGMYARVVLAPAGTTMTSAGHLTDHYLIMVGEVIVTVNGVPKRFSGYNIIPTKAGGGSRAIYAVTDCWAINVCRTDKTEVSDIEDQLFENAHTLQTRNPALGCAKLMEIGV